MSFLPMLRRSNSPSRMRIYPDADKKPMTSGSLASPMTSRRSTSPATALVVRSALCKGPPERVSYYQNKKRISRLKTIPDPGAGTKTTLRSAHPVKDGDETCRAWQAGQGSVLSGFENADEATSPQNEIALFMTKR